MLRIVAALSLLALTMSTAAQIGPPDETVLVTVRISEAVLASGRPLPSGTYQVRLTNERPAPHPGQSSDAQRWVEFVADGSVVAREVAEVLRDDDRPDIGASSERAAAGVHVQVLKGGEFLRISVKRETVRYLIHLPLVSEVERKRTG